MLLLLLLLLPMLLPMLLLLRLLPMLLLMLLLPPPCSWSGVVEAAAHVPARVGAAAAPRCAALPLPVSW